MERTPPDFGHRVPPSAPEPPRRKRSNTVAIGLAIVLATAGVGFAENWARSSCDRRSDDDPDKDSTFCKQANATAGHGYGGFHSYGGYGSWGAHGFSFGGFGGHGGGGGE